MTPDMVAEFNCWKWFSVSGTVTGCGCVATVDSGIGTPPILAMG